MNRFQRFLTNLFMPKMATGEKIDIPDFNKGEKLPLMIKNSIKTENDLSEDKWKEMYSASKQYSAHAVIEEFSDDPDEALRIMQKKVKKENIINAQKAHNCSKIVMQNED